MEKTSIRIRLSFEISKSALNDEYFAKSGPSLTQKICKCWFLVDKAILPTISNLQAEICKRFDLPVDLAKLTLDGIWLPTWEKTNILRDGDETVLRYEFHNIHVFV